MNSLFWGLGQGTDVGREGRGYKEVSFFFKIKPFKIKMIIIKSNECKLEIFWYKMKALVVAEHMLIKNS